MRTTPQTFLRFIAGAAVAAAVLFLVWYFRSIVVYVLISAVLAVMGNPLVKRLAALHIKGWKVPRWLAALATLIVIWVVLATLCSLFVPLVFNKIYQLSNVDFATVVASIEEPIARAQSYLHEFFAMPESTFSLSEALASALKQVIDIESLNTVFASIVNVVLSSVIAIFSITFITFCLPAESSKVPWVRALRLWIPGKGHCPLHTRQALPPCTPAQRQEAML